MPLWFQNLLVIALVIAAIVVVARQALGTLRLRHGKMGSCCAKGCGMAVSSSSRKAERIVFLPVESLTRKKN